MAALKPHRVFTLTIRVPEDGVVTAYIILRHVLKVMWRSFGVKCLAAKEVEASSASEGDT